MTTFGQNIRSEHDSFGIVNMTLAYDPLIEDLKNGLEKFGEIKIERLSSVNMFNSFYMLQLVNIKSKYHIAVKQFNGNLIKFWIH